MGNVKSAHLSPRVCNGVIFWYSGDTFSLYIKFNLTDIQGMDYDLKPGDSVTVTFYNKNNSVVSEHSFSYDAGEISAGTVCIVFDAAESAKFPAGEYTYAAKLSWEEHTTIIDRNKVIVQ